MAVPRFRTTFTTQQLVNWLQAKCTEKGRPKLKAEEVEKLQGKH